jgi:hypothetical protein
MAEYVCLSLADIMAERDRLSRLLDTACCEMADMWPTPGFCTRNGRLCEYKQEWVEAEGSMFVRWSVCAGCYRQALEEVED